MAKDKATPPLITEAIESLEAAVGAFNYQIKICEAYMNQGKDWPRMDSNGVIASMYAATHPVCKLRQTIKNLKS